MNFLSRVHGLKIVGTLFGIYCVLQCINSNGRRDGCEGSRVLGCEAVLLRESSGRRGGVQWFVSGQTFFLDHLSLKKAV
jgi:hypothetical protein